MGVSGYPAGHRNEAQTYPGLVSRDFETGAYDDILEVVGRGETITPGLGARSGFHSEDPFSIEQDKRVARLKRWNNGRRADPIFLNGKRYE